MPTAAQKKRLIEGLAYINTHRKYWQQGFWVNAEEHPGCGTYGCLAGHLAITLNKSKPIVEVPTEVWKKKPADRTTAENQMIHDALSYSEYVRAEARDLNHVEQIEAAGKTVAGVHVQHRANRLIGGLRFNPDQTGDLFHGDNKWPTMVRIAANRLGISQAELKEQIQAVAEARGWNKKKASS